MPRRPPPVTTSIQPTEKGSAVSRTSEKYSESEPNATRRVSSHGPATRSRRIVASTITPVRPRPPTVAANQSACSRGPQTMRSPSVRVSTMRSTCPPKVPATAWFLPCTSFAIAPPTVTFWVPGVTASIQPRRENTRWISPSGTPASQRSRPDSSSKSMNASSAVRSHAVPPELSAASP